MLTCLCFSDSVPTGDVTYARLSVFPVSVYRRCQLCSPVCVSVTPCLQEMSLMLACLCFSDSVPTGDVTYARLSVFQ